MEEKVLATLDNIPKEKAWQMINKFRAHYKEQKYPGAEYLSHGVWFSFEALECWIKEAKEEQCTGLRVYFATYLDKEEHPDRRNPNQPLNYKHRNTIVLVSTKKHEDVERDQYKLVSLDKIIDPLNKGELCPEECGEEIP